MDLVPRVQYCTVRMFCEHQDKTAPWPSSARPGLWVETHTGLEELHMHAPVHGKTPGETRQELLVRCVCVHVTNKQATGEKQQLFLLSSSTTQTKKKRRMGRTCVNFLKQNGSDSCKMGTRARARTKAKTRGRKQTHFTHTYDPKRKRKDGCSLLLCLTQTPSKK